MQPAHEEVHPFFCSGSPYDLCTRTSLWADGGAQSVRDFFEQMRRRELREVFQLEVPENAQAWMETDDEEASAANRSIHDFLIKENELARSAHPAKQRQDREQEPADAGPAVPTPVALFYDLDGEARQIGPTRLGPPGLFTGIGEPRLEANAFSVDFACDGPNRHCRALLIDASMLSRLGELLGPSAPAVARDDPAPLLLKALAPASLWGARRLQRAWACVPGLAGVTDEDGSFAARVDLDRAASFDLTDWVGVVFCVGPEARPGSRA